MKMNNLIQKKGTRNWQRDKTIKIQGKAKKVQPWKNKKYIEPLKIHRRKTKEENKNN